MAQANGQPHPNLDKATPARDVPAVSRLSTLAALLLVALWLPATLHCQIEQLDGSKLFSCAGHAHPDETSHADDDHCADTLCQTIESGEYVLTKTRITFALPVVQACLYQLCLFSLNAPPPMALSVSSAPELAPPWQPSWHFVRRTALPARAPSLILA